jgi:4-hydroxythreonine-4-phosphate dehydrogenase
MNVLDNLWMSRVTSHVSLRTALDQITPQRIDEALSLADATMRGAGFERPRIAVCALNPHAGENGLFGREEIEVIGPRWRRPPRAASLQGPVPVRHRVPQGLRRRVRRRALDVPRPGQIATKLKGFNRGVTVTGGLATVFTTPAHGTAFDIVGQGKATTGALEQAVRLARASQRIREASAARVGASAKQDASLTDYVAGS